MSDKLTVVTAGEVSNLLPFSPQQLALSLFEDVGLKTPSISQTQSDGVIYGKSSLLIDVTSLTLKARQALNVCHFMASETPGQFDEYKMDLALFRWLTNIQTRNYKFIRDILKECQNVKIDMDNGVGCAAIPMLGRFVIIDGTVRFALDSLLKKELDKTDVRNLINMRVQTSFSSIYSLHMYEQFCKLPWPSHTPWYSVDEFRHLIGATGKTHGEFKVLNAKIIQPSLKEILLLSGLEGTMEVSRRGGSRAITHIRFSLSISKSRVTSSFNRHAQGLKRLYEILRDEFGLSDKDLDVVIDNLEVWGEQRIDEAIDYCRDYISKNEVRAPAKLLLKAFEEGWRLAADRRKKIEQSAAVQVSREDAVAEAEQRAAKTIATANKMREIIAANPDKAMETWPGFASRVPSKVLFNRWKISPDNITAACENDYIAAAFYIHLENQGE